MAVDRERVAALVRELLEAIGEDPDRPGLKLTPERVADAYSEFFSGIGEDPAAPLAHTISISRGPAPETLPSGAVMLRDILFRSVCEHHLLPFRGHAHIAYLPGEKVVGLGALPKVVDVLAARPQVQERLAEQIADTISDALDARGVLVVLDATPKEELLAKYDDARVPDAVDLFPEEGLRHRLCKPIREVVDVQHHRVHAARATVVSRSAWCAL